MPKKYLSFCSSPKGALVGALFFLPSLFDHLLDHGASLGIGFGVAPLFLRRLAPLNLLTIFICGCPILVGALHRLFRARGLRRISSDLLISTAMIASVFIGDFFAASEVALIMAVGALLEEATCRRARKGLKSLMDSAPVRARRLRDGREEIIPAENLVPGDLLRIFPGETIPVDGVIVRGESSVDQSVLTGESLPVDKSIGDPVFGGSINRFGSVDVRAEKIGADSTLQKLIRMVREAEKQQAPMQRLADRYASLFVPLSALTALLAWIFSGDVNMAVTILVVFCPCALVLATPTAIMAAVGNAAGQGILIKSGEALEKMGRVDLVAFDKTGTLTNGQLQVSDLISFSPLLSEEELLTLTASAESQSEHPLGKAIVASARARGLQLFRPEYFKMRAGRGIEIRLHGEKVLCGKESFLQEEGILLEREARRILSHLRKEGKASVLVAKENVCLGLIALSDSLRPESLEMIESLRSDGTDVVLLTGDHPQSAAYFAERLGIRRVRAELLPEEKLEEIRLMQEQGHEVCMIGDGVNDAPALKRASVGLAMGSIGSDLAVEAADIALMNDELRKIPYLKRLAEATVKTIRLSIAFSMTVNLLAVALSLFRRLDPSSGALVHNAGSCFAVLLAALLYDRNFERRTEKRRLKRRKKG